VTHERHAERGAERLTLEATLAAEGFTRVTYEIEARVSGASVVSWVRSILARRELLLAGRPRPATDREQRGATLRAVALPARPAVGQGYLARVGNRDLLAADAPALRSGIRRC
jgi:hypothetical protein